MKKKYAAPEMEEIKMDEPIVLDDSQTSTSGETVCTGAHQSCGPSDV